MSGFRYLYNEKGQPILLSYGRWDVVENSNDSSRTMRKLKSAQNKAQLFYEHAYIKFIRRDWNLKKWISSSAY